MFDACLGPPTGPLVRRSRSAWSWIVVLALGAAGLFPVVQRQVDGRRANARLANVTHRMTDPMREQTTDRSRGPIGARALVSSRATVALSPPAGGALLSSWQTIAGCGAGGSGSGGASIKWVGRSVHGGLFNVVQTAGYLHLYNDPNSQDFHGGYNFSSSTQISTDLGERWNVGVVIPYVYKVYKDFKPNPQLNRRDLANRGLGDMSVLLLRKFGAINDTIATLSVGLPTGTYDQGFEGGTLSQETQLGFGRPNASLTVDHVFDEIWGLIVVGGNGSYRGGMNKLESYRAPSASAYSYVGFFAGSFVPSLGLTLTGFSAHDRDVNIEQNTPLVTLGPSVAVEWSSDYVAVLLGGSIPLGTSLNGKYAKLPWVLSLGLSVSPF